MLSYMAGALALAAARRPLLDRGVMGDTTSDGGGRYRVRSRDTGALLCEGDVVIGRSPYCSMIIDNETLSRVHASVSMVGDGVGDGVEIRDLGSSNGTYVNGVRITGATQVKPGDEIMLGKVKIWIEIASERISTKTGQIAAVRSPDAGGVTPTEPTLEDTLKAEESR
jgi:pSer/pThr/pTyr-binding forkhead associated (FHA) protein